MKVILSYHCLLTRIAAFFFNYIMMTVGGEVEKYITGGSIK
jgi:hypothetical protein